MCRKCEAARPRGRAAQVTLDRLVFGLAVAGALTLVAVRWWLRGRLP